MSVLQENVLFFSCILQEVKYILFGWQEFGFVYMLLIYVIPMPFRLGGLQRGGIKR